MAVSEADNPCLPLVVIDREQEQVAADSELANFVGKELVLLRLRCASGQVFKGVDGIPDPFEPTLRTLWRLTLDRDVPSVLADRHEGRVGNLDRILDHRSSESPSSSAILLNAGWAAVVRPSATSSMLRSIMARLSASSALSASVS